MIKRIGKRTLALENRPYLLGHAAAVGKKEGEGPLGERFDYVAKNDRMGQRSWELAESELQKTAIRLALRKATLPERSLDLILAGDLLNQCIGSFLASMHANVPYLGQYGACSTMAQGLALGGCLVESGAADRLLAAASSHFCSAERQYRFPLAYGGQRTPTAQWTTTAAGAAILGSAPVSNGAEPCDVRVTHVLFGKMVEMGVKDAANMGAAMAPAAADTLSALLEDLGAQPRDFDCIVTGDLGHIGADLLLTLLRGDSIDLSPVYSDCGSLIFGDEQDAHAGGSGCGCSAAVLCGPLLRDMHRGKIHRLVFAGTGAMMSPTSVQQGQPIVASATPSCWKGAKHELPNAFWVGGLICALCQVLIDKTKLTPARILVSLVVLGVILQGLGWYQAVVDYAGAGATVPLLGFGYSLAKGVAKAVAESGLLGVFTGGVTGAAGGIAAAIVFGCLFALLSRPQSKS